MTTLGQIIATRNFQLKNGKLVTVSIGKPEVFPNESSFYCPYQITGMGSERVNRAGGVDAVQALLLALKMIGAELVTSDECLSGNLSWAGGTGPKDVGFPLPDSLKDF